METNFVTHSHFKLIVAISYHFNIKSGFGLQSILKIMLYFFCDHPILE